MPKAAKRRKKRHPDLDRQIKTALARAIRDIDKASPAGSEVGLRDPWTVVVALPDDVVRDEAQIWETIHHLMGGAPEGCRDVYDAGKLFINLPGYLFQKPMSRKKLRKSRPLVRRGG